MTVFAIAPMHNTRGKKDATGAFHPEARAFVKLHGGTLVMFNNRLSPRARFREVLALLEAHAGEGHECVGVFAHGFRRGMQCVPGLADVPAFARALAGVLGAGPRSVALYACDAGRDADADRADDLVAGPGGAGGFASTLASELGAGWVDAHVTAAHTTINPHVRRFLPSAGPTDGARLVAPGEALWRPWRLRLRNDRDFRLSFPLWERDAIRAALAP